jgi:hypothetical protein
MPNVTAAAAPRMTIFLFIGSPLSGARHCARDLS